MRVGRLHRLETGGPKNTVEGFVGYFRDGQLDESDDCVAGVWICDLAVR